MSENKTKDQYGKRKQSFTRVSLRVKVLARIADLAGVFLHPLVSFTQHPSQAVLGTLQLFLQSHPHVLLNVTQPRLSEYNVMHE